ncbi:hypothetical protein OROMI_020730 [Orobanche minor]
MVWCGIAIVPFMIFVNINRSLDVIFDNAFLLEFLHRVFGPDIGTPEVYEVAAQPVVKAAMEGIMTPGREFLLRVLYLEIYNEVTSGLLNPTGQNLRVREYAQGTYVEGIKEEVVLCPGHARHLLLLGKFNHYRQDSNVLNLKNFRNNGRRFKKITPSLYLTVDLKLLKESILTILHYRRRG